MNKWIVRLWGIVALASLLALIVSSARSQERTGTSPARAADVLLRRGLNPAEVRTVMTTWATQFQSSVQVPAHCARK